MLGVRSVMGGEEDVEEDGTRSWANNSAGDGEEVVCVGGGGVCGGAKWDTRADIKVVLGDGDVVGVADGD